jgi:hypothetical protein
MLTATDSFDEWVEEIIELNVGRDVKWLRRYIHEETGTLYSEMHIHEMRQHVLQAQKRADRFADRDESWSTGFSDGVI